MTWWLVSHPIPNGHGGKIWPRSRSRSNFAVFSPWIQSYNLGSLLVMNRAGCKPFYLMALFHGDFGSNEPSNCFPRGSGWSSVVHWWDTNIAFLKWQNRILETMFQVSNPDGFQRLASWVFCWRHILIFEAKNIKGMKTTPRIPNNHLTMGWNRDH